MKKYIDIQKLPDLLMKFRNSRDSLGFFLVTTKIEPDIFLPDNYTPWQPCGEGDNRCNCQNPSECGYKTMEVELRKLEEDGTITKREE